MIQLFQAKLLMVTSNFKGRHREVDLVLNKSPKVYEICFLFRKLCYHSTDLWAKASTPCWIANVCSHSNNNSRWCLLFGLFAVSVDCRSQANGVIAIMYPFFLLSQQNLSCLALQFASQYPFIKFMIRSLSCWHNYLPWSHWGLLREKGGKVERIRDEELRDFFDNISKRWRGKMENVRLPSVQRKSGSWNLSPKVGQRYGPNLQLKDLHTALLLLVCH